METRLPSYRETLRWVAGPSVKQLWVGALLAVLVSVACAAQTVKVENLTATPFTGWKRTNVDVVPENFSGAFPDGAHYVVGRPTGKDTRIVDFWVELGAFEKKSYDLATAEADGFKVGMIPTNPMDFFGGPVTLNGTPLQFADLDPDGAGVLAHLRGRFGKMFNIDLWLVWYPDQPAWAQGEVVITCSNPSVPDLGETAPNDLTLKFGDALVSTQPRGINKPLLPPDTEFADGMARAFPVTFVWLRHLRKPSDWATVGVIGQHGVSALGVKEIFPDGQRPRSSTEPDGRHWAAQYFAESVRRLETWEGPVAGPSRFTPTTGAQEDQIFQRGEAFHPDGPGGAELVTYFSALKYACYPHHHLEAGGTIVDGLNHLDPFLAYWDGRPHPSTVVSRDRLGKPSNIGPSEAHGWWGPDVEHHLIATLVAGHRFTGSPACNWLLEHHAHIKMLQQTTRPGWSTSGAFAARARGYEGLTSVLLFRELEDRQLGRRIRQHYRDRWAGSLSEECIGKPGNIWDVRTDPRLGFRNAEGELISPAPPGWHGWQQSIGAYGPWIAGRVFEIPDAIQAGLSAAEACVLHDWYQLPGENYYRYTGSIPWTHAGLEPTAPYVPLPMSFYQGVPWGPQQIQFAVGAPWFATTWNVPAIWIVTQDSESPQHAKAVALWQQVLQDAGGGGSWFPPGSGPWETDR